MTQVHKKIGWYLVIPGWKVDPSIQAQVHSKTGPEETNKHAHGCYQCHLLCLLVSDQLDDIVHNDDNYDNGDNGDNDDNGGSSDNDDSDHWLCWRFPLNLLNLGMDMFGGAQETDEVDTFNLIWFYFSSYTISLVGMEMLNC